MQCDSEKYLKFPYFFIMKIYLKGARSEILKAESTELKKFNNMTGYIETFIEKSGSITFHIRNMGL